MLVLLVGVTTAMTCLFWFGTVRRFLAQTHVRLASGAANVAPPLGWKVWLKTWTQHDEFVLVFGHMFANVHLRKNVVCCTNVCDMVCFAEGVLQ